MTMRFLALSAKIIFAWPLFVTYHAVALAKTYQGFRARAVTFLTFLPVVVITSAVWAMSWAVALWLLMHVV